jgi:hypothetical protein
LNLIQLTICSSFNWRTKADQSCPGCALRVLLLSRWSCRRDLRKFGWPMVRRPMQPCMARHLRAIVAASLTRWP